MKNTKVTLVPLTEDDREQFILDNQWAFKYGAMMEFGERDDHIDDDGEIISRETIERCIDDANNETYRIVLDGRNVGGVILKINKETHHNELEILFTLPDEHSKGIGYGAWQAVEALHPETEVWMTCTPYFEKRTINSTLCFQNTLRIPLEANFERHTMHCYLQIPLNYYFRHSRKP